MMSQKDVAELLGTSCATLSRTIKRLNIPTYKQSGHNVTLIDDKDIEKLRSEFPKKPPLMHEPKKGVWYEQKTLSDYFGVNNSVIKAVSDRNKIEKVKPNHNITLYPDSAIFELYKLLHITKPMDECKLVPYEEKKNYHLKTAPKMNYWKVSVFDEHKVGYLVKAVCLNETEAKNITKELDAWGILARASKHRNLKGEYYYGKRFE